MVTYSSDGAVLKIRPTYRMDSAVKHNRLAHVLEDNATAADLVARSYWHDAHRFMVLVWA